MNCIDLDILAKAARLYADLGYKRVEVPWWVTADVANITKPTGVSTESDYKLSVNGKVLIASGEQSFLYLANKGHLPQGWYQTLTPCFRNEAYDSYHSKQFMKLELIELHEPRRQLYQSDVEAIAARALHALQQLTPDSELMIVETGVADPLQPLGCRQLDIALKTKHGLVEVGSYGARQTSFAAWLYGTGVAEPRFSKAVADRGITIR